MQQTAQARSLSARGRSSPHAAAPTRRRTFEEIDWDTAIAEVAKKFRAIEKRHGGETIFYYGGGQGNHLGGVYTDSTHKTLGSRFRTNALAQEKTGEMWVTSKMFGTGTHPDIERAEVAMFIGKNPWMSRGRASCSRRSRKTPLAR